MCGCVCVLMCLSVCICVCALLLVFLNSSTSGCQGGTPVVSCHTHTHTHTHTHIHTHTNTQLQVVKEGQWWRAVTASISHIDIIHLGFNMISVICSLKVMYGHIFKVVQELPYSHLPTASNKTCVTQPKYVFLRRSKTLK